MSDFPTLSREPARIAEKILSLINKEKSENFYTLMRRIGTRVVKTFTIEYNDTSFLNVSDRALLKAHYEENMGLKFKWTDPQDNIAYTVFYDMEALEITPQFVGSYYSETTLTLQGSRQTTTTTTTTTTTA